MWNYRVIRTQHENDITTFQIHKVYYGEDGSIDAWTANPAGPCGESVSELEEDLQHFQAALRKEVLEEAQENGKPVLQPVSDAQENK
jgi:hypothetical protein